MNDLRTWDAWRDKHQPFEIDWHRQHPASDPGFIDEWTQFKAFIKASGDVLDIGCGPRPPFAPCTVIDPLAIKYQTLDWVKSEWWDGVKVYARPAENLIAGLKADTVVCWNCLDHTIGWIDILDNMLVYGRPGARFAVSTDFYAPFLGHPGYERERFMIEIGLRFNIIDSREPFGRQLALLMTART